MFGQTGKINEEFINAVEASIVERKGNICDTWDAVKVLSLPWGVKETVSPDFAEEVKSFTETLAEQTFDLPSGNVIEVLKADVKERKGNFLMILRYAITTQA